MRLVGLKNTVYNQGGWQYLLFYDFDGAYAPPISTCRTVANDSGSSWLLYSTKHGYHFAGLTPISARDWATGFTLFQSVNPAFYSGQTLRITRKEGEQQRIIDYRTDYPVIERLWAFYSKRLGISGVEPRLDTRGYRLVFETYKTKKE